MKPKPSKRFNSILYPTFSAFLALCMMTGCGRPTPEVMKEEAPRSSAAVDYTQKMAVERAQLEATRLELEASKAIAERRLRDAEVSLEKQQVASERVEKSRSVWRSASAFLVVLAGLTLFAGAILGSQAKKEVKA